MRINFEKPTFSRGEVTPRLWGRTDLQSWHLGLKNLSNMLVLPQGGLTCRPAFKFIGATAEDAEALLAGFIFSQDDSFLLEFTEVDETSGTLRFHTGGGTVVDGDGNPVEVATPYGTGMLKDAEGIDKLQFAQSGNVVYIASPDVRPYELTRIGPDQWTLEPMQFMDGPYDDIEGTGEFNLLSGAAGTLLATTFTSGANAFDDNFTTKTSSENTGALGKDWGSTRTINKVELRFNTTGTSNPSNDADPGTCSWKLQGSTNNSTWIDLTPANISLTMQTNIDTSTPYRYHRVLFDFGEGGPGPDPVLAALYEIRFYELDSTVPIVKVSGTYTVGGALTLAVTNSVGYFETGHIGTLFLLRKEGTPVKWAVCRVTAYTSPTSVSAVAEFVVPTELRNIAATDFRVGAWSGVKGWPSCVAFHEERLWFASTATAPQTIWGSVIGDFTNFVDDGADTDGPNTDDYRDDLAVADDAVTFAVASGTINRAKWLVGSKALIIGTAGSEFIVKGGSLGEAISADNINITQDTNFGVNGAIPIKVGPIVLFAQRGGRNLFEYGVNFNVEGFDGTDISILSEHIIRSGVTGLAYTKQPQSILWLRLGDGTLAATTYQRDQDLIGWSRHNTGDAVVSIATIPDVDDEGRQFDALYACVKRTIDGNTKYYIERLDPLFEPTTETGAALHRKMRFVDSYVTYDSTAAGTISGVDHLEGETVDVLADGVPELELEVSSGDVTLTDTASVVHIGLRYTSDVESLPISAGTQAGAAHGRLGRIHRADIRVRNSGNFKIVGDSTDEILLSSSAYRQNSDMENDGEVLDGLVFTGIVANKIPGAPWEREVTFAVRQDNPLPLSIDAFILGINKSD